MICVTFAMIQDWNVKVAPVFALAFCMLASWSFLTTPDAVASSLQAHLPKYAQ
jgi:hypothetical protein